MLLSIQTLILAGGMVTQFCEETKILDSEYI